MGRRKSSQIAERLDRSAVVRTAADLADRFGDVNQVALAQLADHFGVRVPSLYNHIEGLDALRREVALLGLRELAVQLRQAAIGKAGDDAIASVAHAYREFALAHPARYAASIRSPDPQDTEMSAVAQDILNLLLIVLAPYRLKQDEALHVIRALRSVLHGFVSLEAAGGFGLPLDRDESFARLLRMFLDGLNSEHHSLAAGKGVQRDSISRDLVSNEAPSQTAKRTRRA
jgi:AcrR family transcriptional regulator